MMGVELPKVEGRSLSQCPQQSILNDRMSRIQTQVVLKATENFKNNKNHSSKKVLILDDEPYNVEVLKSILLVLKLDRFAETVNCCYDAEKALKLLADSIHDDEESGAA